MGSLAVPWGAPAALAAEGGDLYGCDRTLGKSPVGNLEKRTDPPADSVVRPGQTIRVTITWRQGDWGDSELHKVLDCVTVDDEFVPALGGGESPTENDGRYTHEYRIPEDAPSGTRVCDQAQLSGSGPSGAFQRQRSEMICLEVGAPTTAATPQSASTPVGESQGPLAGPAPAPTPTAAPTTPAPAGAPGPAGAFGPGGPGPAGATGAAPSSSAGPGAPGRQLEAQGFLGVSPPSSSTPAETPVLTPLSPPVDSSDVASRMEARVVKAPRWVGDRVVATPSAFQRLSSQLAHTGSDPRVQLAVGLALVGGGALLLRARRLRRRAVGGTVG